MFPNVRLLIGTLFIAILVLSCEFGVFAALRVSREPLNRLTAESAPLQLAAGHNAPPIVATSWAAPREAHAPAPAAAPADIATDIAKAAAPAGPVIETPEPAAGGAARALDSEATAAVPQAALTPSPAAAPMQQDSAPLAVPAASAAPAQIAAAPALRAAAPAPAQDLAAAPPSLAAAPTQQTPAPAANAPLPAQQAAAAAAPAAAVPAPAAQPADITGSVPNAAAPAPAIPEAAAPHGKPAPKIVRKPAKKPRKEVRKPAPVHPVKKRIVRRARAPAAASSSQPANTFDNPVFASAPQSQSPAKKRPRTKKAATTNNGFGAPFGTQFSTQ